MQNGKPPATPQMIPPFVRVFVDPAAVSDTNPNGINVQANLNTAVPGWELAVIQLLSEGIQHWTEAMRKRALPKVTQTGLVMPDGRPAVIQESTDTNSVQG